MLTGVKIDDCLTVRRIYSFFMRDFEPEFFFKGESHDFYEAVCCLSGEIGITAGKEIFSLRRGEMTLHPPSEFHAIRRLGDEECRAIIFSFSANHFPSVIGKIFGIGESGINDITDIFAMITESFELRSGQAVSLKAGKEMTSFLAIKKLEIFMLRHITDGERIKETKNHGGSELFAQILSYMEDSISRQLNVSEIADSLGVSVPTLEKTVNKYLSCGVISHFNALKMQRAHNLLSSGLGVSEVARELGFSNQNYFSARFKRYFGYPPSSCKYRQTR